MGLIVLLGNLGFSLASLVFGIRLCLLARRTGELPERLLGISFLTGGFLANTIGWILYTPLKPQGPLYTVVLVLLRLCVSLACSLLLVMAWKVFRPNARWAKLLVQVMSAILATYVIRDVLIPGPPSVDRLVRHPLHWVQFVAMISPYVWLTWEAARYQAQIRRRWRIGLPADLVVATRMQFWGLGMATEALMFFMLELIRVLGVITGRPISPALMISLLGILCTVSLWLAFFMPASYLRRIELQAASPPE